MMLTKRAKIIVFTALTLLIAYVYFSGSGSFEALDINKVSSIDDPVLKTVVKATEECNKLKEGYKNMCYRAIAELAGYHGGHITCESLKGDLRPVCYEGYGREIGERYPDISLIQEECSKTSPTVHYESCMRGGSRAIGLESANQLKTEQCNKLEADTKRICYEGIGRGLAQNNRGSSLCEETEDKEMCLVGFAYVTDKNKREEALSICQSLDEEAAKRCYFFIGINSLVVYKKTVKEAFKDCEQYPHAEKCKQGAAWGLATKPFEENKQKIVEFLHQQHLHLTKPSTKGII